MIPNFVTRLTEQVEQLLLLRGYAVHSVKLNRKQSSISTNIESRTVSIVINKYETNLWLVSNDAEPEWHPAGFFMPEKSHAGWYCNCGEKECSLKLFKSRKALLYEYALKPTNIILKRILQDLNIDINQTTKPAEIAK